MSSRRTRGAKASNPFCGAKYPGGSSHRCASRSRCSLPTAPEYWKVVCTCMCGARAVHMCGAYVRCMCTVHVRGSGTAEDAAHRVGLDLRALRHALDEVGVPAAEAAHRQDTDGERSVVASEEARGSLGAVARGHLQPADLEHVFEEVLIPQR